MFYFIVLKGVNIILKISIISLEIFFLRVRISVRVIEFWRFFWEFRLSKFNLYLNLLVVVSVGNNKIIIVINMILCS